MSKPLQVKHLHTDVLIIGGGTAGCYATLTISRNSGLNILVAEKAIYDSHHGCFHPLLQYQSHRVRFLQS